MIHDLEQGRPEIDEHDVCIIGAGPAGIVLATRLADHGQRVLLLEAGGERYAARSQAFYRCTSDGRDAWPETTRLRYLGGTSNHWAGRCRPLLVSDFAADHDGEMPGWPIGYDAISAYLPEAMRILELPPNGFVARNPPLNDDFPADVYAMSPPVRFGSRYRDRLAAHVNLDLCLNANAVELTPRNGRIIGAVRARNYRGDDFVMRARRFVLAMGALENARFLLNQVRDDGRAIGDEGGLLGRCFMEHMNVQLGHFLLRDADNGPRGPFQYFTSDAFVHRRHIGKGNVTFSIVERIKSYGRTAAIKTFFKRLACDWDLADKVEFIARFDCPGDGVLTTLIEQVPGRQSYLALSDEVDELGLRVARLHWEVGERDLRTIREIALAVAEAFANAGLGMVKLDPLVLDADPAMLIAPHAHHMGTTRMAADPAHGVVDANCRVFGTDNLYVAGSSIFATGGASNPTMPLLQFALRLGDHLLGVAEPIRSK